MGTVIESIIFLEYTQNIIRYTFIHCFFMHFLSELTLREKPWYLADF